MSMSAKLLEGYHTQCGVGSLAYQLLGARLISSQGMIARGERAGEGISFGQQESVFGQGRCILCTGPHPRVLAMSSVANDTRPTSGPGCPSCPAHRGYSSSLDPTVDLLLVSLNPF